jgi:hypothetical protein
MIIQTVDLSDFRRAFRDHGRSDQFSHEALELLFDHFDQTSDDIGEPWELDVIAICCDFSEYDSAREAAEEQGWDCDVDPEDFEDDAEGYQEAVDEAAVDWLQDRTTVLELDDGGVVIQAF